MPLIDLPGFLIVLAGLSGLALAYLAAAGRRVNIPVQRGAVTAFLGSLAVLLILWRMFAGSPTLKIGIFLDLGAAFAIAAGALMALAEDGFEPLVAVAGRRTRAASDAPTATQPAAPPASAPASRTGKAAAKTPARKSSASKPAAKKRAAKKSSARRK